LSFFFSPCFFAEEPPFPLQLLLRNPSLVHELFPPPTDCWGGTLLRRLFFYLLSCLIFVQISTSNRVPVGPQAFDSPSRLDFFCTLPLHCLAFGVKNPNVGVPSTAFRFFHPFPYPLHGAPTATANRNAPWFLFEGMVKALTCVHPSSPNPFTFW